MDKYLITTPKGKVICYEVNGVYFPLKEEDNKFLYENVLDIERIFNEYAN